MNDPTFVQYKRTNDTKELLKHPNAFTLFSLIAFRARREPCRFEKLNVCEARVGDYKACGLTRQEYRTALDQLERWNFITYKTTNKGTIATIIDSSIYDINAKPNNQQDNQQATSKQPSSNQQATTNKNVKKDNKEKNDNNKHFEISEFSELMQEKLNDWLHHKDHKYKERGWKSFKTILFKAIEEHGEQSIIDQFDKAISGDWKGPNFDKMEKPKHIRNISEAEQWEIDQSSRTVKELWGK